RGKSKPLHTEAQRQKPAFIHTYRSKLDAGKSLHRQAEKQRRKLVSFDWENITGWPTDPGELAELREILDVDIQQQFRNGLSQHLRTSYDAPEEQPSELDSQLDEEFDKFLVCQAEVLGVRLLVSDMVLVRVLKWSLGAKDGIHYLDKFTKALVKNAKIRFDVGNEKGDISSEDWHLAKVETTRELAALQKEIRREWAKRHRLPGFEEIKETINRNAEAYY